MIGQHHGVFTHVPVDLLVREKKQLDLKSPAWLGVLASTGTGLGMNTDELVIVPVALAQAMFNSNTLFRVLIEARSRETIPLAREQALDILKRGHRQRLGTLGLDDAGGRRRAGDGNGAHLGAGVICSNLRLDQGEVMVRLPNATVGTGLRQGNEIQITDGLKPGEEVIVFGGGSAMDVAKLVAAHFDLRPKGIIQMLDLLRPIYSKTAAYGHFGREEPEFTWEKTDKAAALRAAAGL